MINFESNLCYTCTKCKEEGKYIICEDDKTKPITKIIVDECEGYDDKNKGE